MDQNYRPHASLTSGIKFNNLFFDPDLLKNLRVSENFLNGNSSGIPISRSSHVNFDAQIRAPDGDNPEDLDFSDAVLKYINHILMEEDLEDKACMFQESAALQAAEKSFYDVIGEQYPTPSNYQHVPNRSYEILDKNCFVGNAENLSPDLISNFYFNRLGRPHDSLSVVSQPMSHNSSSSNGGVVVDGPMDSPVSILRTPDFSCDFQSVIQFNKGLQEASKFLPNCSSLIVDLRGNELLRKTQTNLGKVGNDKEFIDVPRGKKNSYHESIGFYEERSNKQSAICSETIVSAEMFDTVLLCSQGRNDSALRKALSEVTKNTPLNSQTSSRKRSGKKKGGKMDVVDLRTLLTLCAQAVAADDHRTANEFLKQIRQNATPTGDGMQRLAHYFADGLEARMAGSRAHIFACATNMPTSAADILKAYHILLATCPFKKISNFFSNRTILNVASNATKLHIVDFGILYGFQWPSFLQSLSSRPGGPPNLRITGIDFPCPGFRPAERVEETGRRLANYAETFKVPFKFNAIAQKWDTITVEDLKIDEDELLVVNCMYRFKNLLDETVVVSSPRNSVLNLIRKMNPAVFVLGIANGAYNAPFFITRFREALFHYSSLFDMLDVNIPREIHERMLLEKTVFGHEAMNVIACEAAERIERPETYKQWQVRNTRAGFQQLPLNKEITKRSKDRVKSTYHKDFVIDEDGRWLLQGWKGRMLYALSSWRPAY